VKWKEFQNTLKTRFMDQIKGHDVKDCAMRAINLLSYYYNLKLTPKEQYFLGKEIMESSGAFTDVPSKMNVKKL